MLDVKLLVDNKPSITGRFRYGMQVSYMRPTLCFKDELGIAFRDWTQMSEIVTQTRAEIGTGGLHA